MKRHEVDEHFLIELSNTLEGILDKFPFLTPEISKNKKIQTILGKLDSDLGNITLSISKGGHEKPANKVGDHIKNFKKAFSGFTLFLQKQSKNKSVVLVALAVDEMLKHINHFSS